MLSAVLRAHPFSWSSWSLGAGNIVARTPAGVRCYAVAVGRGVALCAALLALASCSSKKEAQPNANPTPAAVTPSPKPADKAAPPATPAPDANATPKEALPNKEDSAPQAKADPQDETPPKDKAPDGAAKPAQEQSAKALLRQASSVRLSEDESIAMLEQARAAGATAKQAALAANARGEQLFAKPERAEKMFTWAQNHYSRHPLPVFNRAKLAAIRGDIASVREHLQTVKTRGGVKLLQKVGFDPTFALVHDDPQVRSLIR